MIKQEGIDRDGMVARLRVGTCKVVFEKKDGTMRTMMATLKQDEIPGHHQPKTDLDLEEGVLKTTNAVRVFDVENDGWRSFIVDNVKEFWSN